MYGIEHLLRLAVIGLAAEIADPWIVPAAMSGRVWKMKAEIL